jgi:carbon-monoxide dehydrogenase medium subunit
VKKDRQRLQKGVRLGLRRAQAIAVINLAIILRFDADVVSEARVTLGCLAPTVVHAPSVERYLVGQRLDEIGRHLQQEAPQGKVAPQAVHGSLVFQAQAYLGLARRVKGPVRLGPLPDRHPGHRLCPPG